MKRFVFFFSGVDDMFVAEFVVGPTPWGHKGQFQEGQGRSLDGQERLKKKPA